MHHFWWVIQVIVSQSAYNGTRWYTKNITKASGYLYSSSYKFEGFVYCGIEFDNATPDKPSGSIVAGQKATLNNTPCYESETTKQPYTKKTGTYYLWDDVVKNGRIRITNAASRVGVAGQVTCWVNVADIGLTTTTTTTSNTKPVNEDYRKSREPNRFKVMLKGKQIEADTLYDNAVATAKKYGAVIIDGKTKKQIYP